MSGSFPAYQKALEIFRISRAVASYFSGDKHVLEMNISSSSQHRLAGFLVTDSLQLAPGVASALSEGNQQTKLKRLKSLRKAVLTLKIRCRKLEFSGIKETEFVHLLRKEIAQFEKLITDWFSQIENSQKN
ncbi:hypothetical protein LPB144_06970 [Christiangramia salexigens]|uniref:Four helix bundle protein n=1 Tax=Christiangramia salexigens TaxID=1913577 RepID=A0A1L3J8H1_9FLAO|nr:hypothetical protein LPB144_06970 [Christiangramia salexigens]